MALVKGLHSSEYDTVASDRLVNALVLGRTQSIGDKEGESGNTHQHPEILAVAAVSLSSSFSSSTAGDGHRSEGIPNNNNNNSFNNNSTNNYSCLSLERISEEYLLTGDRTGNVYLYRLSSAAASPRVVTTSSSSSSSTVLSSSSMIGTNNNNSHRYGQKPIRSATAPSLASISPITLSTVSSPYTNTIMGADNRRNSSSSGSGKKYSIHEQQQMHSAGLSTIEWYSVDNGLFITGGYNNGLLGVWDTNTFQVIHSIPVGYAWSAASASTSSSSSFSSLSSLNNKDNNTNVVSSFTKPRMIYCTKMSSIASNHALVAVGTDQPGLQLIDLVSSSSIHTLQGHGDGITSIDWHPLHEYLLVSGSLDGTVRLWDVRKNNKEACLMTFDQYKSQNENSVMSLSSSSSTSTPNSTVGPVALAHTGGVNSVHFSTTDITGSTVISFGNDQRPRCWRIQQQLSSRKNHHNTLSSSNDNNDHPHLRMEEEDHGYVDTSISTDTMWNSWNTLRSYISSLGIPRYLNHSSISLVTASSGYNETGILCIPGKRDQSSSSARGRGILMGGIDSIHNSSTSQAGIIYVFDIESGELLTELKGHHGTIMGLCYRKSTQELYSCGDDGILFRWQPLLLKEKRFVPEDTEDTNVNVTTSNNNVDNFFV